MKMESMLAYMEDFKKMTIGDEEDVKDQGGTGTKLMKLTFLDTLLKLIRTKQFMKLQKIHCTKLNIISFFIAKGYRSGNLEIILF